MYRLRGVTKTFQTRDQALSFLSSSPGYVRRRQKYLATYWPGLLAEVGKRSPLENRALRDRSAKLRGVAPPRSAFDKGLDVVTGAIAKNAVYSNPSLPVIDRLVKTGAGLLADDDSKTGELAGRVQQAGIGKPLETVVGRGLGALAVGATHPEKLPGDIKQMAIGIGVLGSLAGITSYQDLRDAVTKGDVDFSRTRGLGADIVKATVADYRARYGKDWRQHAAEDPLFYLLDGLAAAGAAAKGARIGSAIRKGANPLTAVRQAWRPRTATLREGNLVTEPVLSRNAAVAAAEKAVYGGLQKAVRRDVEQVPSRTGRLVQRVENAAARVRERQVGIEGAAEQRVSDAVGRSHATALRRISRDLTPAQQVALRVVHEQAPLDQVLASVRRWAQEAKTPKQRKALAEMGVLREQAAQFLADDGGVPVLRSDFAKPRRGVAAQTLSDVSAMIERVAGDEPGGRERILLDMGLLEPGQIAYRRSAPGRVHLGAENRVPQDVERLAGVRLADDGVVGGRVRGGGESAESLTTRSRSPFTPLQGDDGYRQFVASLERNEHPQFVDVPSREQFAQQRNYIAPDGTTFAVDDAGVVRNVNRPRGGVKGQGAIAILRAIREGGRSLDVYDAAPARVYEKMGFRVVARVPFDPAQAKPGWASDPVLQGKPDVVFMAFAPEKPVTKGKIVGSYEEGARIADVLARKAEAEVPAKLVGAEDFSGGISRIPDVPKWKLEPKAAQRAKAETGAIPQTPGSLRHGYTGALRRSGNIREDTARLVAESHREAQRFGEAMATHDLVVQAGNPIRLPGTVPIKTRALNPGESIALKEVLAEAQRASESGVRLTKAERARFSDAVAAWKRDLFPDEVDYATVPHGETVAGVVWVPKGMLKQLNAPMSRLVIPRGFVKGFDEVNSVIKFGILGAKGSGYVIPQMAGNAFMNIVQQGGKAFVNTTARAPLMTRRYGAKVSAAVDEIMGQGMTRSLMEGIANTGYEGKLSTAARWAGEKLNIFSDMAFRRSALEYEARKAGFKGKQGMESLLFDAKHKAKLAEVSKRAKAAVGDFERMGPTERDVIRRVVFIYPWLKVAQRYGIKFMVEHPVAANVAATQADKALQDTPYYAEGLVPIPGSDKVTSAQSWNPLGTLSQEVETVAGSLTGKYPTFGSAGGMLNPVIESGIQAAFGRDLSTGKGSQGGVPGFAKGLYGQTAVSTLAKRLTMSDEASARKTFPYTPKDALLQYGVGTVAPRPVNREKLAEQAQRDEDSALPPGKRAYRKVFRERQELLEQARQAVGVKELPKSLKEAFNAKAAVAAARANARKQNPDGGEPYMRDVFIREAKVAAARGLISKGLLAEIVRNVPKAPATAVEKNLRRFREQAWGGYLDTIRAATKDIETRVAG